MVLNDSVQKQRWGDNGERTKNRSSSWTSGSELQLRFFKDFFVGCCKESIQNLYQLSTSLGMYQAVSSSLPKAN